MSASEGTKGTGGGGPGGAAGVREGIDAALDALRERFPPRFAAATTEPALRDENAKILGKKGELTAILKQPG